MHRVLVFVNPVFEERPGHRAQTARVVEMLKSSGLHTEVQETLSPQSAGDQARRAIEDGFDRIFVCGGDGTIFNVLQGVAGTEVPIGIIPMGTGNVLAQNLRLPRSALEAAKALLHAKPRSIPLGCVTIMRPAHQPGQPSGSLAAKSWYFAMAAGMGLHAVLMSASDAWGKHIIGRASYYFAGISLLAHHRIQPFQAEITTVDGRILNQRVCEAIAVRVPELNRWRPGGRLEEPLLRLATVEASSRWTLVQASFQAIAQQNGHNSAPRVHYNDAVRVVCRPIPDYEYETGVLVEADGEVLGSSSAVISMAQERFSLLWP